MIPFFYTLFFIFIICQIGLIIYLDKKGTKETNMYWYENFPSSFTTLGVLGTFVGIYFGLQDFDTSNIEDSIPSLLEGLKTAFLTSIIGIFLSVLSKKISLLVLDGVEKRDNKNSTGSLNELELLYENTETLKEIKKALGGDGDSSLLTQIQKLRNEQRDNASDIKELLAKKFDEFSKLLQESNTEALVEAMKESTKQFNEQMKEIVDKLVKENFEALNQSVQNMITWQTENKEGIETLIDQFKAVVNDFETSSTSIKEIAENTEKLTNDNSHLKKLIEQLQAVMVDDTKYQDIVHKLTSSIETLKNNTEAFDNTTNKLNNWVKEQMNFSDSVAVLLNKLKEVKNIKDINEVFWKNTEKQLNEGVGLIKQSSKSLSNDLENINEKFYERLDNTFQNFDNALQRMVEKYDNKQNRN